MNVKSRATIILTHEKKSHDQYTKWIHEKSLKILMSLKFKEKYAKLLNYHELYLSTIMMISIVGFEGKYHIFHIYFVYFFLYTSLSFVTVLQNVVLVNCTDFFARIITVRHMLECRMATGMSTNVFLYILCEYLGYCIPYQNQTLF